MAKMGLYAGYPAKKSMTRNQRRRKLFEQRMMGIFLLFSKEVCIY